jgi:phosphoenolpyruvate synthase/pyruvate phosphate dikinase
MDKYVKHFGEISKSDADITGGKGASLGEMTRAGIPVPPGFVILAGAFEQFLKETDLNVEIDAILETVNHQEMHTVEHASEKIQALILRATMPKDIATEIVKLFDELGAEFVAVRSSATAEDSASAAWAGQLDSFLNTTHESLLENVQRCFASLFTPRAIFYRFEKGLHDTKISVAVVVQKMVASEVSGIAFSVHPVTEDRNQLIVEAGFGLGEAIVSGSVTPDSYVVEKSPRRIIDSNVNTQTKALYRSQGGGNEWITIEDPKASSQVLNDTQILELSTIILEIENHYGFPCDIEWAFEGGKFYITQSRPITTLFDIETVEESNLISTDWELWIQRKGLDVFSVSLFHIVEGILMQQIIGGGASKQLCIRKDDEYMFIRSTSDFEKMYLDIANFVKTQPIEYFEKVFTKAHSMATLSSELISRVSGYSNEEILKNFRNITDDISTIVLYNTSVPYFILSAIEIHKDVSEAHRDLITKESEKLRSTSLYHDITTTVFEKMFEAMAHRFSVDKKYIVSLSIEEMVDFLESKIDMPNVDEVNLRSESLMWMDEVKNKTVFSYNQSLIEKIKNKIDNSHQVVADVNNSFALKGTTAFPGKVSGVVRIINSIAEIHKMNKGDIMVAHTTNPNLMQAIFISGGIITDEGGMACHAAIVARELKKPCIIGTKIATQVLKDGDLVEVDADSGVVRILERKSDINVLTNIFSREKSLYYFDLWNQCDRKGAEMFFGLRYEPILFIISPKGKKGSVWYWGANMDKVNAAALQKLNGEEGKQLFQKMMSEIEIAWKNLEPYAKGKSIENLNELKNYQRELLRYWQTMNSALWAIIDDSRLPEIVRSYFIGVRERTERYSERWSLLPTEYFETHFPEYNEIISFITFKEMVRLADGTVSDEEFRAFRLRTKGCYLVGETVHPDLGTLNSFLASQQLKLEQMSDEKIQNFEGTVAFSGHVQGRVKIVDGSSDVTKIMEGNILVTQMTNPKYVPAIKLAAAVITDEGGALCHAAIVARELKKPCIIGTKIATQVLKDGDLVEVDAENGVVRILERA